MSSSVIAGPAIATLALPDGTAGAAYSQTLAVVGGQAPYAWSIVSGTLPLGLSLNASTGAITGTPIVPATSIFTVRVTDSNLVTDDQALSITMAGVPNLLPFGGMSVRGGMVIR